MEQHRGGIHVTSQEGYGTRVALFVISAAVLIVAYLACRYVTSSKLGRILVSIRDAESRTRFMGYRVEYYKLFVFVMSAMLAGIAGALFVPQVGQFGIGSLIVGLYLPKGERLLF